MKISDIFTGRRLNYKNPKRRYAQLVQVISVNPDKNRAGVIDQNGKYFTVSVEALTPMKRSKTQ